MSNKQLRNVIRVVHLVAAVMIFILVYSEAARASSAFMTVLQVVVIPVATFSGIGMWQQAALSRFRRQSNAQTSVKAH